LKMNKIRKAEDQCFSRKDLNVLSTEEFYSTLTKIIVSRFVDRLVSGNGDGYSEAVLDCLKDVFGIDNSFVRKELATAGYLEVFMRRSESKKAPEEVVQEN
jgi:hypothetical protein